jgi:hypothetical protein
LFVVVRGFFFLSFFLLVRFSVCFTSDSSRSILIF